MPVGEREKLLPHNKGVLIKFPNVFLSTLHNLHLFSISTFQFESSAVWVSSGGGCRRRRPLRCVTFPTNKLDFVERRKVFLVWRLLCILGQSSSFSQNLEAFVPKAFASTINSTVEGQAQQLSKAGEKLRNKTQNHKEARCDSATRLLMTFYIFMNLIFLPKNIESFICRRFVIARQANGRHLKCEREKVSEFISISF